MGENGEAKKDRQRGGFALVEVLTEGHLDILTGDLAGQKECREVLLDQVERGAIKADGERTFGIVQIKCLDLVPKMKPAKATL